ncbi:MAG: LPS export ABC transporter periplasmic protein LptC [Bacteroidetes bacterium]|nr:LPS export ABC transporter periplasmic protein LptC [Bacteroidota bacterium]
MQKLIYISLFFISLVFVSCEDKFEPPKSDLSSENIPVQESWNSSVTFSDSGFVKAILKAGHISAFSDKGYTIIDSGAVVDFYKNGEIVSTLTGRRGKVEDNTKDIEIYDSVRVVNKSGSELKTSKLLWKNKTQKVYSDVFVSIKTPKERIEGVGFESDQNLTNYKIYQVSGVFDK